jgi:hypothetical protein
VDFVYPGISPPLSLLLSFSLSGVEVDHDINARNYDFGGNEHNDCSFYLFI